MPNTERHVLIEKTLKQNQQTNKKPTKSKTAPEKTEANM